MRESCARGLPVLGPPAARPPPPPAGRCFFESEATQPFRNGRALEDFAGAAALSAEHQTQLREGLREGGPAAGDKRKGGGGATDVDPASAADGYGDGGVEGGGKRPKLPAQAASDAADATADAATREREKQMEGQATALWGLRDKLRLFIAPADMKVMLAANGKPTTGSRRSAEGNRASHEACNGRVTPVTVV